MRRPCIIRKNKETNLDLFVHEIQKRLVGLIRVFILLYKEPTIKTSRVSIVVFLVSKFLKFVCLFSK
jgi:hypothetical protein